MYIIQLAQPGFSKKTFMILISHYKGYGRITHIYTYIHTYIHIKKKRKRKRKGKSFKLHICDVSVVKRAKKYPKKEKKQLFVMIKG